MNKYNLCAKIGPSQSPDSPEFVAIDELTGKEIDGDYDALALKTRLIAQGWRVEIISVDSQQA